VALVGMGVVAGLALGDAGDDASDVGRERGPEQALAGTPLAPDASGRVEVVETGSGAEIWLRVDGLPPATPGTYYQAWVRGEGGSVTVGTFHLRTSEEGEPVILWAGVDLARYPTFTVTVQQEGVGAESSGQVVLSGEIV
jgi:hypothetical protein